MPEQRLGILGGMGPQATQDFYQRILDRTDASCDQEHLPTLIWSDTSIPDRTTAILGGMRRAATGGCWRGAACWSRGGAPPWPSRATPPTTLPTGSSPTSPFP